MAIQILLLLQMMLKKYYSVPNKNTIISIYLDKLGIKSI